MIVSLRIEPGYDKGLHDLVRLFFPKAQIEYGVSEADLEIILTVTEANGYLLSGETCGLIKARTETKLGLDRDCGELRWEARRLIYELLRQGTGRNPSPYGILTGVKPTKLVHRLYDQGQSEEEARRILEKRFLVSPSRAGLLTSVATTNRPYLNEAQKAGKTVGIYIGIPYCPSRCYYCSFPGYPLEHKPSLAAFVEGLKIEMVRIGEVLAEEGWSVPEIYFGGGTPTVLDAEQWAIIAKILHRFYISEKTREFTVEAGRPETLDPEVLTRLRETGVNRICINPQTMNNETLRRIGRHHTSEQIEEAFLLARRIGFVNINMDLILGLPGEGLLENLNTLRRVIDLEPEGITVHTLARKRGSYWNREPNEQGNVYADQVNPAIDEAFKTLTGAGYIPYYLYRQKYMVGHGENLGYARPGFFSLYNIQVIEERQTIIGMGGGAASKFVNTRDWSLTSMYHPKDPGTYLKGLETLVTRQVDKLKSLP